MLKYPAFGVVVSSGKPLTADCPVALAICVSAVQPGREVTKEKQRDKEQHGDRGVVVLEEKGEGTLG